MALDPKLLSKIEDVNPGFTEQFLPFYINIFSGIEAFITRLKCFHSHKHSLVGLSIETAPHHHENKEIYHKTLILAAYLLSNRSLIPDVDKLGKVIFSSVQTIWLPICLVVYFPWFFVDNSFDFLFPKALEWGAERLNKCSKYFTKVLVTHCSEKSH